MALAAGFLAAAPARASQEGSATDPLTLVWSAPASCPSRDEVKAAALRAATHATETVVATASVEQTGPNAWHVRLTMRGSERDIDAPTCAGVADATAVVLALALMPTLTLEPPPPTTAPSTTPQTTTPSTTASPTTRAPSEARPAQHRFAAGIAGAGVLGTLPSAAVGGALDLAWTPSRFRLEAEGTLLGPQSAHASGSPAGARFHVSRLGGRGCYAVVRTDRFDLAPCAGLDATFVAADGFGADKTNLPASTTWGSVAAGALARGFLTPWLAVRLRGEGDVALAQPRFLVQNVQSQSLVFRPPTIGAALFLGAEVLFL